MTQENLAYKAGVALSTVKRIERGGEPSLDALRRIAPALGVRMADLLGEAVA